jgi:hypothetical protein
MVFVLLQILKNILAVVVSLVNCDLAAPVPPGERFRSPSRRDGGHGP